MGGSSGGGGSLMSMLGGAASAGGQALGGEAPMPPQFAPPQVQQPTQFGTVPNFSNPQMGLGAMALGKNYNPNSLAQAIMQSIFGGQ